MTGVLRKRNCVSAKYNSLLVFRRILLRDGFCDLYGLVQMVWSGAVLRHRGVGWRASERLPKPVESSVGDKEELKEGSTDSPQRLPPLAPPNYKLFVQFNCATGAFHAISTELQKVVHEEYCRTNKSLPSSLRSLAQPALQAGPGLALHQTGHSDPIDWQQRGDRDTTPTIRPGRDPLNYADLSSLLPIKNLGNE
jgi:hypothetical protein